MWVNIGTFKGNGKHFQNDFIVKYYQKKKKILLAAASELPLTV